MKKNYKLTISYDGSRYYGWEHQKSTAMTIGGQKLSDAAKELELAGKRCFAEDSTDEKKQESAWYIRSHHERTMSLYDKLAEDAERWLKQNDGA